MEIIMMGIDRFTESAQDVAQRAAEIMQRYSHHQIDTEHQLLALLEQTQGGIFQLLEFLKVDANALSKGLYDTLRTGPKGDLGEVGPGQISITPRAARVIDLADEKSRRLKDDLISSEHLFLAILSERDTPAAGLLEGAGLTHDRVYEAIQQMRG
jgi:ATP-dependent Clp protease ATP-binding subunit ClpC